MRTAAKRDRWLVREWKVTLLPPLLLHLNKPRARPIAPCRSTEPVIRGNQFGIGGRAMRLRTPFPAIGICRSTPLKP